MLLYPLEQLDEPKLLQICGDLTPEGPTLEFKRELPVREFDAKAEFLKDVAALANAEGGDLVYGIEEKAAAAFRIFPISVPSIDGEMRRLGQLLDSGIEPRITGVRYQPVPVTGGHVLVLRVPQSFDGPHRITHNNSGKFVMRTGTHITEMSYDQLRNAFDRTSTLTERVKRFRAQRLDAIQNGATPKPIMGPGPRGVVHVIPLASMTGRHSIDVSVLSKNPLGIMIPPWYQNSISLNLDGVVTHNLITAENPAPFSYNQVFRSGATESVFFCGSFDGRKLIPSTDVTNGFRSAIAQNITALKECGLSGPAIVGIAMMDVAEYQFAVGGMFHIFNPGFADRNALILPDVWVDSLDSVADTDSIVKPQMDILWQAFGADRCLEYSQQGAWSPRG